MTTTRIPTISKASLREITAAEILSTQVLDENFLKAQPLKNFPRLAKKIVPTDPGFFQFNDIWDEQVLNEEPGDDAPVTEWITFYHMCRPGSIRKNSIFGTVELFLQTFLDEAKNYQEVASLISATHFHIPWFEKVKRRHTYFWIRSYQENTDNSPSLAQVWKANNQKTPHGALCAQILYEELNAAIACGDIEKID